MKGLLDNFQELPANVGLDVLRVWWVKPHHLPVSLSFLRFVGDVLIILQDKVQEVTILLLVIAGF